LKVTDNQYGRLS